MKKLFLTLLLSAAALMAQTRPVTVTWTASTSSGVTGYILSKGTALAGPFTQVATTNATTLTFTDSGTIGTTIVYQVVATAAACTPTTPITQGCGTSPGITTSTTVPPQPGGTLSIVVNIP
jgi:hypothetical protein